MGKAGKKTRTISANYMDLVFKRNPEMLWREKAGENGKLVEVDMVNKGFFNKIAQKFFHRPRVSHIALDKYGSLLWLAMDGKASVNDLLTKMKEAFPEEKDKMLNRLVHFLSTLESWKFIIR